MIKLETASCTIYNVVQGENSYAFRIRRAKKRIEDEPGYLGGKEWAFSAHRVPGVVRQVRPVALAS
jgi:hypothetical protein